MMVHRNFVIFCLLPIVAFGYFQECYVTPCTRDVIIVLDGSSAMQTTAYVSQEINTVLQLINKWTLSDDKVRLAIVGAYFGNEFSGLDYFTDSYLVEKRLQQFRLSSMQYGLFKGDFNTTIRFLDERYTGPKAIYGPRSNVQKRIIIVSSHSNQADVASTKAKLEEFAKNGYGVTIIGVGVTQALYSATNYQYFISVPFTELGNLPDTTINQIIGNGVCYYDVGVPTPKPQTCTTMLTTPTTTPKPTTTVTLPKGATTTKPKPVTTPKPVPPTQPPFPVGDYQNCSCSTDSLYIDIVFVVDTSAGMGAGGLMMVKAEINTLVGQMTLDPDSEKHVQVGLVKYSEFAEIVFHPSDYTDEDQFTEDLWTSPKLEDVDEKSVEVNLHLGLIAAERLLAQMRKGVKKVVVVYAASYNDEGLDDARQTAYNIRESGHDIITVAFVEPESTGLVLKLGEISSPRMNFTSYRDELLVDELEDAFCQVNCYCPNLWQQLILENRKYGECFFSTKLDSSWTATKFECPALSGNSGNGHLIYINSQLKNDFINKYYMKQWDEENKETPNYDIGYKYNTVTKAFEWVNGVTNNPYANWAPNEPNMANGECAAAVQVDQNDPTLFKWHTVNCMTSHGRGICQKSACDSDFFCSPQQ